MPNWVYNSVSVSGDQEQLDAFLAKAIAPHPETFDEATGKVVYTDKPEFSFWNFVAPPKEAVESGEYFGTHGWAEGKALGDTSTNWYNWNNDNWNTKWDACDVYTGDTVGGSLSITYSTAWSIPEPVMEAMVKQHPELTFEFSCEEEQGWGADYSGSDGELVETKSWDIPDSHSDYVERDNEDGCICSHYEDEDDWYKDCPRETKEFFVEITRTYKVIAKDAEQAWEIANGTAVYVDNRADGEMSELVDETTCVVKNELGQRVYPIAENGVVE
jgi:hypothetical protein